MDQNENNQLLSEGMTLQNGKYAIKERLSSGGFGNTYVVVDKSFEDKFALKEFFIKGINARDDDNTTVSISNGANQKQFESQKEKFKKEARRLRKLNNRHIVRVYDMFEENNTAYYVMDYIDGESLSSRLKRTKTPLSENEAMTIFSQVLDALEEVHKLKIWHLDLKPGNILVDKNGNVVLIDFGASKQLSTGEGYETTTNSMCYTPGYAPSEQVDQNMDRIGPWTDLYALGATLYNLITCTPPPTVSEIDEGDAFSYPANISKKVRSLIEWMMNPKRIKRPQSVAEVRKYLSTSDISGEGDDDDTVLGDGGNSSNNQGNNNGGSQNDEGDDGTILGDRGNSGNNQGNNNGGQNGNNGGTVINGGDDGYNNKMKGWTFSIISFIVALVLFLVFKDGGCNNRAQAPVEETLDSIAEVVDSVIDSLAYDTVYYNDNW